MNVLTKPIRYAALALTGLTLAACQPNTGDLPRLNSTPDPLASATASVSAADPRAQAAGEKMLADGGSATDAAIAVMLALTVVEPQSSGIGGGGFYVRGTADGEVETLDGRETAPAGADPQWFMGEDGELRPYREALLSGLSVGVPGNIAMVAEAHKRHGVLPWSQLFEPAIALARDGFAVNRRLYQSLDGQYDRAGLSEYGRSTYYTSDGKPKPVGTIIRNPDIVKTLEAIAAAGPDAFYRSESAASMANAVRAATPREGGMTADDVAGYVTKEREPVCGTYRGYKICGMGPPSSGAVAVVQILGQLERFNLRELGTDSPTTWHLFLESQRLAYADREIYLADGDYVSVPVAGLIDRDYLARRSALIDPETAITNVQPGIPAGAPLARADGDEPPENGTSHFAVVDKNGTMVSYTSTIEGAFGSGLIFGGFYLNNELTDFSRSPIVDGKPVANRVEGGKRPRSSMAPTIIYSPDGKPFAAIGAAGGTTIPVQTARGIIGLIDFDLPADKALGLPLLMAFGDRVMVEEGTWFEEQMDVFAQFGHSQIAARKPPLKAGVVHWNGKEWVSARDPRLDGLLETTP
ncbi:gamma-glutamyltransferase [Pontixanthobacter aquaemixtae]|uniref:Glutathione hydrolase proenzyme n=1 Tax=Pontixanthobacter aquaemixtae TaxID=1958940 RepID=A0A844ZU98_9SPHN|nr:gamma-glutamyltransferase [Pontixanthobacter aquaemixtae]MXO91455.1 gamma-glutamyltransferase [Pontixanthobacter aquaemixtae]